MDHSFTRLIFLFLSVILIGASEYCPHSFFFCKDYCCGVNTCCSSCSKSVRIQPSCSFEFPVAAIIAIVFFIIVCIIIASVIIAVCCGFLSISRMGFQRRRRFFNPRCTTANVMNVGGYPPTGQVMYPQGQAMYPQGQAMLPQGQAMYPQGQAMYPQGQAMLPPGQVMYPQGQVMYPEGQAMLPQGPNYYPDQYVPQTLPASGIPPPYPVKEQGSSPECKQRLIPQV